jgi:hypothetical protein
MSKVSIELSASARNDMSRIFQALAQTNNSELAVQLGVDASTFSRMKNDKKSNGLSEVENACALFSLLGFKIVPKSYESLDRDTAASMFHMMKCYINRVESVDDLFHSEISGQKEKLGY